MISVICGWFRLLWLLWSIIFWKKDWRNKCQNKEKRFTKNRKDNQNKSVHVIARSSQNVTVTFVYNMIKELISLLIFAVCMGCLPMTILLLFLFFKKTNRAYRITLCIISSLTLCTFLWYFHFMGVALSDITGNVPYPKWTEKYLLSLFITSTIVLLPMTKKFDNWLQNK